MKVPSKEAQMPSPTMSPLKGAKGTVDGRTFMVDNEDSIEERVAGKAND